MKRTMMMIGCLAVLGLTPACQDTTDDAETKPSVDPDAELTGKADGLSNHYTELKGELPMDDVLFDKSDYPDYFHGYTIDLDAGQTVQFTSWADARGLVRLYGPAGPNSSPERPKFGRAQVRSSTRLNGDRYQSEFTFEVEESGTYMLVYGPYWVWHSEYELSTKCLGGCEADTDDLTVADILANPSTYDGQQVTLTGNILAGPAICTELACGPDNPCCNSCGASQNLYDGDSWQSGAGLALTEEGERYSCGGNECTVADNCTVESGRYEVTGVITVDGGEASLEVTSRTPVTETCTDDSDCADGWCRPSGFDSDAPSECAPFVGEGESCGGFAPPQYVNACDPDLTCVYRPFVADAPGACRNVVTVQELRDNPDRWDGVRVSIDGYINTGYAICTQMACTIDNPCCNSCGASQTLDDEQSAGSREGLSLVQDGETLGCGGDNCNYQDNCSVEDGEFRALGVFNATRYGVGELTVEELTSLESL